MKRVAVVGNSGSGKTWLARRLAARLGYPHVELDAVFWQPNWSELPTKELRRKVTAIIGKPSWIVDGNYVSRLETLVLEAADTVVWLDLPRHQVITAVIRRTLDRGLRRTELWNGNRESLRNLLRWEPEENIVRWAWVSHPRLRARYEKLRRDPALADLDWIRLRSRREVGAWLAEQ